MIGVSQFEVLYGYHSQMVDYVPSSHLKVQGVLALDTMMRGISGLSFQRGEILVLSTKNLCLRFIIVSFKEGKTLAPRFTPVKVTERIGSQAYKERLPVKYSRFHDVILFHYLRSGIQDRIRRFCHFKSW